MMEDEMIAVPDYQLFVRNTEGEILECSIPDRAADGVFVCGDCSEWTVTRLDHHCPGCGAVILRRVPVGLGRRLAGSSDGGGPHDQLRERYGQVAVDEVPGDEMPDGDPIQIERVQIESEGLSGLIESIRQLEAEILSRKGMAKSNTASVPKGAFSTCPKCGGDGIKSLGNEAYCLDCDWDNLDVLPSG